MSRKFQLKTATESVLTATSQIANAIVTYAKLNLADADIPAAKVDLSDDFNFTGAVQKNGADLATQSYVDSVVSGLDLKDACRAGVFVVRGASAGQWTGSGNTLTAVTPGQFLGVAGVDSISDGYPVPIQLNTDRLFVFICTDPDSPFETKLQDPYAGLYTLTTAGCFPAYAGGTTYAAEDLVYSSGFTYQSLVPSNTGNTPASSPTQWQPVLAHDVTGVPTYAGGTTYAQNEVVVYSGVTYRSRVGSNTGNTPASSPTQWAPLPFVPVSAPNTSAVMTRTTDANSSAEVTTGMYSFIARGENLGGSGWVLRTEAPITLNSTPLDFTQFSGGGGTAYSEGGGIQISGDTISVRLTSNNSLSIDGGTQALWVNLDGSTLENNGGPNQIRVKDGGVTYAKLAADVLSHFDQSSGDLITTNSGTTTSGFNLNPTASRTYALELVHIASLNADRAITCVRFVRALLRKGNAGSTPVLIGTSEDVIYDDTDPSKRFCDQNSGNTDASSQIDSTFVSFTLGTDSIVPTVNGVQSGSGYSVHHTLIFKSFQQV